MQDMNAPKPNFSHQSMPLAEDFVVAGRASYLGGKRAEAVSNLDERFGPGNWTIGYILDGKVISRDQALQLYEQSYETFLRNNPAIRERLIREARDIYDTAPSNVESGLDYHKQEDSRSHLQDIAIRRALKNMGLSFQGDKLMQVRDVGSDFPELSPGKVPFVLPATSIPRSRIYTADWVQSGSVEDFWQNNKYIFARNQVSGVEHLRAHLDHKLAEDKKENQIEIEDSLRSMIVMGTSAKDLTERYLAFLDRNGLQSYQSGGTSLSTPKFFLSTVIRRLPDAITTHGWGTEQAVRAIDSLTPLFAHLRNVVSGRDFLFEPPKELRPLLQPIMLCAFLHHVEFNDWPTKANIDAIFSIPGALETIEKDPHCHSFLKRAPIMHKSAGEISQIVMPPTMLDKKDQAQARRLIALLLELKKEVEQGG